MGFYAVYILSFNTGSVFSFKDLKKINGVNVPNDDMRS